jgi:pSer/pThr/pTyr-binding forkhead associated (FHA) protein
MDLSQLVWIIPLALAIVALLQLVYWVILSLTSGTHTQRSVRQPSSPIMPSNPGGMNTSVPGYATQPPTSRTVIGKVVVVSGLPAKEIPIPGGNFGIGRFYNPEQSVQVAIDEKSISRRHAAFTSNELLREYYLTDNGSSYGTSIQRNNQFEALKPGQPERIYNEDVVQFGNVVRVRFMLPTDKRTTSSR